MLDRDAINRIIQQTPGDELSSIIRLSMGIEADTWVPEVGERVRVNSNWVGWVADVRVDHHGLEFRVMSRKPTHFWRMLGWLVCTDWLLLDSLKPVSAVEQLGELSK